MKHSWQKTNIMLPRIVLWGGTGQAKVVRPIIEQQRSRVVAIVDDTPGLTSPFSDVPIYHGLRGFQKWITQERNRHAIGFCIAIGNPHGRARLRLHDLLVKEGLTSINVIHSSAIIADNAKIGDGAQILAGAIIQPEVVLGRECIINTGASVDHECILEDGVEIAPGAVLAGSVHIETGGWIASGAIVLPRLRVGADAIVGAGAVVTKNVPARTVVAGVPARHLKSIDTISV
ncbi:MAG: hypothetical protein RL681_120 [Candidatus Parcubacteria bacterium]|jgi:sugar O-acyltransferase (sialic acid O-acetyltransferase NeuD family)